MIPEAVENIVENMKKVLVGKSQVIELAVVALICEGHLLIEDVPGIGKTTLAKALARSVGCSFSRIQCTPDLLPSDITGIYFFDQKASEFVFRPGPLLNNIVLADEINRATPRTQSSLLESMEERQVTVDGVTMQLPRPFIVIATQNPVELQGTFPLPEAQLDRFMFNLRIGYPDRDEEDSMLLRFEKENPLDSLTARATGEEIIRLKQLANNVYVEESIRRYILEITGRTRNHPAIQLGASPRASLALYKAAQAYALARGRDYVIPDDVKSLAVPTLGHRLILNPEAFIQKRGKEDLIEEILSSIPISIEDER